MGCFASHLEAVIVRGKIPRRGLLSRAFTLLEVLLSVAIFLLLAGGIFAAVSATTQVSTEVALMRIESERFDALQGFLRKLFSNLPPAARLELRARDAGASGAVVELLISQAPAFAVFTRGGKRDEGLALAAIPDKRGALALSLSNIDVQSLQNRDQELQAAFWITLMPDIRQIRWRFAATQTTGLQETWVPNDGRPGLADLEISLRDGTSRHWQFFIPAVQIPGGRVAP